MTRSAALATASSLVDVSGGATVTLSQLASLHREQSDRPGSRPQPEWGRPHDGRRDSSDSPNESTLTISNGALLNLSGGSSLNVTGALINFIGTGNSLNITNNLLRATAAR